MRFKDYELATGEMIAIAIRYAMQDDMTYFRRTMSMLRDELHWTDEQIGNAFMEIGQIMFQEDLEDELQDLADGEP
jgi:hypothetical protein